MGKRIKLDLNEVLKLYDSVRIPCPVCGRKMIPMDWVDYCPDCKKSIKRDYDSLSETKIKETEK